MATMTVTCHTDGCGNAGHPIDCEYDPAMPPDSVQCGVCSQPITDTTGAPA
jgi:hypothetical protein